VAGAGGGPAGVEEDVEEQPSRYEHSLCCRYRTEDGSSARCRVDQPRTQIKRKGNSGDGLLYTAQHAGPSIVRVVGGEQRASGAASPPSGERSPSHGVYYKTRQESIFTGKPTKTGVARTRAAEKYSNRQGPTQAIWRQEAGKQARRAPGGGAGAWGELLSKLSSTFVVNF
jgi:hypothetical protein